jgi:capsular polysaccharide biosynthesis protein
LLVLAAFGAVIGAAAALVWPSAYASQTEVLLQGPREKTEVLTEAQVAMSLAVLDRTATGLGWGVDGASLRDSVTAEVTNGNVIGITATAPDPNRARELAQRVTEEYITFSTELLTNAANATKDVLSRRQATVEQHVTDMNQRITQLQGSFQLLDPRNPNGAEARAELERLRNERTDAFTELDNIDKQISDADVQASVGRDSLRVIEPAVTPSAPRPPTTVQMIFGGAVLAVVLGALVQVMARLSDRRLRRRSDIAAAVGAPILGTVQPPAEATAVSTPRGSPSGRHAAGRRSWIGQLLLGGDPQPSGVHDQALENLRYQRVLAQLKQGPSGSAWLLVVLDGDDLASRAVARLAVAAAAEGAPVRVMTDSPQISAMVEAFAVDHSPLSSDITLATGPCSGPVSRHGSATVLGVVAVSAAQPTIPNCPDASAALVVVTSGTTTGGELLAVAEACHDAGAPVEGVLLVVQDADEEDAEPEPLHAARNGLSHGSEVALVGGERRAEHSSDA